MANEGTIKIRTEIDFEDTLDTVRPIKLAFTSPNFAEITQKDRNVASSAIVTLYDAAAVGELTSWDFILLYAPTVDFEIEFTCKNIDANEQIDIKVLKADLPMPIGSNVSRFNIAAGGDGFAAVADVIDLIRAKNIGVASGKIVAIFGKV